MAMTLVEKILARSCGREKVVPDEIVDLNVDLAMTHDALGAHTAAKFEQLGAENVWDPSKVVVILDHYVPNKDVDTAKKCQNIRRFVQKYGIQHYYEVGRGGICHQVLLENGHVLPGMVVVGTDSHTTTAGAAGAFAAGIGVDEMAVVLKSGKVWERVPNTILVEIDGTLAFPLSSKDLILWILSKLGVSGALFATIQFTGTTVSHLSVDSRITLTNMAIEAGATNGIIEPDEKTLDYLKNATGEIPNCVHGDPDAHFARRISINTEDIKEPLVAAPPSPANVVPVGRVEGTHIDQAFVGSCTNGRLEDLQIAERIIRGRRVHSDTRLIVIPASQRIYEAACEQGLLASFVRAGAAVSTPTCGPCMESHMGVLGPGEVSIATSNRNFPGRAGDPTSEIYLASPATVAASAVEGQITNPKRFLGK